MLADERMLVKAGEAVDGALEPNDKFDGWGHRVPKSL
jgi:hypothetical protein